ncbi:LysR family transcriptional regulator [Brevibacterium salitolerans]|uniref:LysR family transcriptional regulator n=1 Tax=Brevibacterium salitolerans TaxID=1403566 RepID=A0ABN2W9W2_9MICO
MSLEWSRLRILDAVARTGSVGRAAALLHMTGPAVSQQLRRIEAEAGIRVVIPDGRGVRLTSAGRVLAGYAAQVADLMTRAENDLHHGEELVGRVCMGVLASFLRTPLADALASFQRMHPRVELRVEDGETAAHLALLTGGRLDLVCAESWSISPLELPTGVTARTLSRETAWIALPEQHRLRGRERLDFVDLAAESWVTCARDSDGHRALVQAARITAVEPEVRHFVADRSTQMALVRAGLAVACIPSSAQPEDGEGVVFRPLAVDLHRQILLLAGGRPVPRPVDALIRHLTGPDGC